MADSAAKETAAAHSVDIDDDDGDPSYQPAPYVCHGRPQEPDVASSSEDDDAEDVMPAWVLRACQLAPVCEVSVAETAPVRPPEPNVASDEEVDDVFDLDEDPGGAFEYRGRILTDPVTGALTYCTLPPGASEDKANDNDNDGDNVNDADADDSDGDSIVDISKDLAQDHAPGTGIVTYDAPHARELELFLIPPSCSADQPTVYMPVLLAELDALAAAGSGGQVVRVNFDADIKPEREEDESVLDDPIWEGLFRRLASTLQHLEIGCSMSVAGMQRLAPLIASLPRLHSLVFTDSNFASACLPTFADVIAPAISAHLRDLDLNCSGCRPLHVDLLIKALGVVAPTLRLLDISHNRLIPHSFTLLAPVLARMVNLHSLAIGYQSILPEDALAVAYLPSPDSTGNVAAILAEMKQLRTLSFERWWPGTRAGDRALCAALCALPWLQHVYVGYGSFDYQSTVLAAMPSMRSLRLMHMQQARPVDTTEQRPLEWADVPAALPHLREMNLHGTVLSIQGRQALDVAALMTTTVNLRTVVLDDCLMSPVVATSFARGLWHTTNLRHFSLVDNPTLGSVGLRALAQAFPRLHKMRTLSLGRTDAADVDVAFALNQSLPHMPFLRRVEIAYNVVVPRIVFASEWDGQSPQFPYIDRVLLSGPVFPMLYPYMLRTELPLIDLARLNAVPTLLQLASETVLQLADTAHGPMMHRLRSISAQYVNVCGSANDVTDSFCLPVDISLSALQSKARCCACCNTLFLGPGAPICQFIPAPHGLSSATTAAILAGITDDTTTQPTGFYVEGDLRPACYRRAITSLLPFPLVLAPYPQMLNSVHASS